MSNYRNLAAPPRSPREITNKSHPKNSYPLIHPRFGQIDFTNYFSTQFKTLMPYYRVLIWIKNKPKPMQGIRFSPEDNIDTFQNLVREKAFDLYGRHCVDVEAQMLSVNCTAVRDAIRNKKINPRLRKV
jgi:hypothetical protein